MSLSMSVVTKFSTLLSALLVFSLPAIAYTPNQTITPEAETEEQQSIEIITVTGLRSLGFFRKQYRQAEEDFFDAINALALDQSFNIKCENKNHSFSRIQKRVCEPKYVNDIKYELIQLALGGRAEISSSMYKLSTRGEKRNQVMAERKKHLAALQKSLENNPELQALLLNVNKAKYSLEQKKIEVFGEEYASAAVKNVKQTQEFVENSN